MYIQNIEVSPYSWGHHQPITMGRNFFFLLYNRILRSFFSMSAQLGALAAWNRKAIFTLFVQTSEQNRLDSAPRVMFRMLSWLTRRSGHFVGHRTVSRWLFDKIHSTRFAFADFVRKVLIAMTSRKPPVRTTITLTDAEVDALQNLRKHFDTQSVSETIRRSIAQSSLLKRYSDEEGDLLIERDGKKFVIPSRR